MLLNRAKAATITAGTGAVTLGAAIAPYQTWAAAGAVNGDTISYLIEDGAAWEIGRGTYSAGTVTRPGPGVDPTFASSTGALLALSGAATVASAANVADISPMFQPPLAAYFDTLWSGTGMNIALTDDADVGLLFDGGTPVGGDLCALALKTLPTPAAAWSIRANINAINSNSNFSGFGIVAKSTANGKLLLWELANSQAFKLLRLTLTGYSGEDDYGFVWPSTWFRMDYDGAGTITVYSSANGKNWLLCVTQSIATWLGAAPDLVGFGVDYNRGFAPNIFGSVSYWSLTGGGL